MPPSVGIPLDPLAPALDTPSEMSRHVSFSTPRWAFLNLVLEGVRLTYLAGRSTLPRGSCCGACLFYLAGEGRAMAVRFLARWAHLFRRETLEHYAVVESVASCEEE